MSETRTYTTRNGRTVESALSFAQAVAACAESRSNFARDLARKANRYDLSPEQLAWLHILACEHLDPPAAPEAETGYEAAVEYLTRAVEAGLRWPKVRLEAADGSKVVLSLAGARARRAGTVNLTDGRKYPTNTWWGRISETGEFEPGRALNGNEAVREVLRDFCADPAATARAQGALTGRCCFCGRDLETRESVGAGYGPICAAKWGLPWGAETAAAYEEKKEEVLESIA